MKHTDIYCYLDRHYKDFGDFSLINVSGLSRAYCVKENIIRGYICMIELESDDQVEVVDDKSEKKKVKFAILDGYIDTLNKMLDDPNVKMMAAFKRLQILGYRGGYGTVKNYAHTYVREPRVKVPTMRRVHQPGDELQFDWKEDYTMISKHGEAFTFNILVCRFHYCDAIFGLITIDRTQKSLFRALDAVFTKIGGVPKEALTDNMKSVVDQAKNKNSKTIFNNKFKQFASDYGFKIKACRSYRAQEKGTAENGVYIAFNRLLAYNNAFDDLEHLQVILEQVCEQYNDDICQSTRRTPNELFEYEKEHLNPLPNDSIRDYHTNNRMRLKVSVESAIVYENFKYSVPPKYISKYLDVDIENNVLHIYDNTTLIRIHQIKSNKTSMDFRTPIYHADDLLAICKLSAYKGYNENSIKHIMYNNYFLTGYIDGGYEMFNSIIENNNGNDNSIEDEEGKKDKRLEVYDFE